MSIIFDEFKSKVSLTFGRQSLGTTTFFRRILFRRTFSRQLGSIRDEGGGSGGLGFSEHSFGG